MSPRVDPNSQPDTTLRTAELALRAAQLASDTDVLAQLIDDDLFFTGPDGAVYGKADDLDAHRRGWVRIHRLEPSEERVHQDGDIAIVSVRMAMAGSWRGEPFEGVFRYTRVWKRGAHGWRVVAGHVSAVSAGTEPDPA